MDFGTEIAILCDIKIIRKSGVVFCSRKEELPLLKEEALLWQLKD